MICILRIIGCTIIVDTIFGTLVSQFVISSLTGGKSIILCNSDFTSDGIVVCAVVSDIQTSIAIHEGQVTITVETTGMTCS